MTTRAISLAAALAAVTVAAATWAALAGLPFFSESYTGLALAERFTSPADAFDPALVPFRPLQHLFFYLLSTSGAAHPAGGRAVLFALHIGSALLVFAIARRLDPRPRAAAAALALFLALPSAKGLAWVAAVSGPARTLCMLFVVRATLDLAHRRPGRHGLVLLVAFAVGLGFHQSAILVPAIVLSGVWLLAGGGVRERTGALARTLRTPSVIAVLLLALAYLALTVSQPARPHHGVVALGAVAANVARASLALAPEWLRLAALAGLRGDGVPFAGGGLAVAAVAALLVAVWWRGGGATRWLLLVAFLDLVPPVLTTGFVTRYAYFAGAVAALLVGPVLAGTAPGARTARRLGAAALFACWAVDHVVDVREIRQAGALADRLLARAAAVRAEHPGRPIALVDAPDHTGRENDFPLFNRGLPEALRRRGADGPWILLRVAPCWTGSDHRPLREDELQTLLAREAWLALRFAPARGDWIAWPPPR